MAYPRTTPVKWLPSAAAGVSVSTGGGGATPWLSGAWVQVSASMAATSQLLALAFGDGNLGASEVSVAVDLGVGAIGSEVVIATRRFRAFSNVGGGEGLQPFVVPIDQVPAGSRLAIRMRNSSTGIITWLVAIGYVEALDSTHVTAVDAAEVPTAADVSVTPNGTAWANSAWFELTAGIASQIELAAIIPRVNLALTQYELDLGIGTAGAEVVIATVAGLKGATGMSGGPYLPRPYRLDASTRVAVRLRKAGTDTTVWNLALEYYADPLVEPTVQTLPATPIRSTAATLRGRIDPNGIPMTGRFAWGTSPGDLSHETDPVDVGSGTIFVTFTAGITDLLPETTYYFRAIGNDGTSDTNGAVLSFTTLGEHTFIDGEVSHPLAWLELTTRDAAMTPFAEVDLNDAATYYGGYKRPWVIRFLPIARGLSDRDGQIEHMGFGALFSDSASRYFRGLLEDPVNKYLTNRPLVERFIDDEERRIEGLPRIAAVGFVNDYAPRPNLQFELKGSDWLKKKYSRKRKAQQSWQPLITVDDFPDAPEERLQTPAPIIYGALGLTGADPVENVAITVNAQPTAAPTNFAIATVAGGTYAGVTRYYRVSGIVSGQETIQTGTLSATTDNTNRTIRTTWDAIPSATSVRIYTSHRADFAQFYYQELAAGATSYDDTTTPIDDANRAPWNLGLRLNLTYYVWAKLAGGLYSRPGIATTSIMPIPLEQALQDRDIDLTWDAHPDEVSGYRIVRHRSYYSAWNPVFDRQWDVSTGVLTVTDDVVTTSAVDVPAGELIALAAAGQVEAVNVGPMTIGSPGTLVTALLVARHACARVGNIYVPVTTQNVDGEDETTYEPVAESAFGDTWFAPDHAGWVYPEKYVEINGRWFTLIFTTVSPVPAKVLVDVDGVEATGDGTGTLMRSLVDQRLHFMNNWIAPDTPWQSGVYLTAADTVFPHLPDLPLVDEASHAVVKAALSERLGGSPATDYEGAGIIGAGGEFVTATDALARFQVSGDFDQVFNRKGQDSVSAEPVAPSVAPPVITDVISIRDGSFSVADQVQTAFFNILPYVHTRDYTGRTRNGWYGVGEVRSQTSIDNYDQERESPRFELHFCRANTPAGVATIADVMARKRARYQDPRRLGTLEMPFAGLSYEPGTTVAITHVEGIGATGWTEREVRLLRHEVLPTEGVVQFDFYDLTAVFANQGSPA